MPVAAAGLRLNCGRIFPSAAGWVSDRSVRWTDRGDPAAVSSASSDISCTCSRRLNRPGGMAIQTGADGAPGFAPPATPEHSCVKSTPRHTMPRNTTRNHAKPCHTTPRHATPRKVTPWLVSGAQSGAGCVKVLLKFLSCSHISSVDFSARFTPFQGAALAVI